MPKRKPLTLDDFSLSDTDRKDQPTESASQTKKPDVNQKTGKPLVSTYPKLTLYFPKVVHKQLREIAYEEEVNKHDLMREALNMLFKSRGLKSVEELIENE